MFAWLISTTASFILWFLGWHQLDDAFLSKFLNEKRRKVVIYPHTSYWDFTLFAIYALSRWSRYRHANIYAIMASKFMQGKSRCFFEKFNCIPVASGGFVQAIVNKFQKEEEFHLFIAPDGTTQRQEWRSGYFYLAQKLECPIQVVALDYHLHQPVIKEAVWPSSLQKTQSELKEISSTVPSLHPKNSVLCLPHVKTSVFANKKNFTPIIVSILLTFLCRYA